MTPNWIVVAVVAVVGLTWASTSEVWPAAAAGSAETATSSAAARAARSAGRPKPLVIARMTAWVCVNAVLAACYRGPEWRGSVSEHRSEGDGRLWYGGPDRGGTGGRRAAHPYGAHAMEAGARRTAVVRSVTGRRAVRCGPVRDAVPPPAPT